MSVLSRRSESAIDSTLAQAAGAAERAVSLARVVFFATILVRFLLVADLSPGRMVLTTVPLAAGILFSLWVLVWLRRGAPRQGVLLASVLLDAGVAFTVLLANVLWPSSSHPGILYMPDTIGILVATLGAGFRLSPTAALVGGLANAACLVGLVAVDRLVSGPRFAVGPGVVSIYVIFVLGFGLLAAILARTTRRLAVQGANAARRAERAEQGLGSVLAESHDLSSLLASATLDAEHLAEAVEPETGAGKASVRLLRSLRRLQSVASEVKNRAMVDLTTLNQRTPVEVDGAVTWAVDQVRRRYPDLSLAVEGLREGVRVVVAGGRSVLHRMLLNLLCNACESNGVDPVSRVWVRVEPDEESEWVRIRVLDDGPGLPEAVTEGQAATTKPHGTGVGLSVVRGLAEASGGLFSVGNRETAGTRATLTLLRA